MTEYQRPAESDDWYTPAHIFDALGVTFDMDVAAPAEGPLYVPCKCWLSRWGLEAEWWGFVWMNPPFGGRNGLVPWLDKFVSHGNGIALVPDRTSAPWFQNFARQVDMLLFVSPKPKFIRPDGSIGKAPGNGVVLCALGDAGVDALSRANGKIGFVAEPAECWRPDQPPRKRGVSPSCQYRTQGTRVRRWERNSLAIWQNWKCYHCGCSLTEETATLDHLIPLSCGGSNRRANKVAACKPCNQDRSIEHR